MRRKNRRVFYLNAQLLELTRLLQIKENARSEESCIEHTVSSTGAFDAELG